MSGEVFWGKENIEMVVDYVYVIKLYIDYVICVSWCKNYINNMYFWNLEIGNLREYGYVVNKSVKNGNIGVIWKWR